MMLEKVNQRETEVKTEKRMQEENQKKGGREEREEKEGISYSRITKEIKQDNRMEVD